MSVRRKVMSSAVLVIILLVLAGCGGGSHNPKPTSTPSPTPLPTPMAECGTGNESVLQGQYAFLLEGYDNSGFAAVAGSFTADGTGHITAGEADSNGAHFGVVQSGINPAQSSYSVGADNRGCATLVTQFGTLFTRISVGSISDGVAGKGRIIFWGNSGASALVATGQIAKQVAGDFASGPAGTFVFRDIGQNGDGRRVVCAGVMTTSGGQISNVEEDCNDAGYPLHGAGGMGSYAASSTAGRGAGTLYLGGEPIHIAAYMVSGSQIFFLTTDTRADAKVMSGEMQKQTANEFGNSSFSGNAVLRGVGEGYAVIGSLAGDGAAGTGHATALSVMEGRSVGYAHHRGDELTYTVASNGRMALNLGSANNTYWYLYSGNRAFGVTVDDSAAVSYAMEPQSNGPFSTSSIAGSFIAGSHMLSSAGGATRSGITNVDAENISGVHDLSSGPTRSVADAFADPLSVDGTTGELTIGSSEHPTGIVVSADEFLILEDPGSAVPGITVTQK